MRHSSLATGYPERNCDSVCVQASALLAKKRLSEHIWDRRHWRLASGLAGPFVTSTPLVFTRFFPHLRLRPSTSPSRHCTYQTRSPLSPLFRPISEITLRNEGGPSRKRCSHTSLARVLRRMRLSVGGNAGQHIMSSPFHWMGCAEDVSLDSVPSRVLSPRLCAARVLL